MTRKALSPKAAVLLLAMTFGVVSCGGGGDISSIEDLRDAYVKAGGKCGENSEVDVEDESEPTTMTCEDDVRLSFSKNPNFVSVETLGERAALQSAATVGGTDFSALDDLKRIVGDSWRISGLADSETEDIAKKLGASIVGLQDDAATKALYDGIVESAGNEALGVMARGCNGVEIAEDGQSVTFDTGGEDNLDYKAYVGAYCMLHILRAPTYIFDLIGSTRALDGIVTESWSGYKATWNYHPDNGLNLTIIAQGGAQGS